MSQGTLDFSSSQSTITMTEILNQLDQLRKEGRIAEVTWYFVSFLSDRFQEDNPLVLKAAALVMQAGMDGNVGVNLDLFDSSTPLFEAEHSRQISGEVQIYGEDNWVKNIVNSVTISDGSSPTPLVLEGSRIYLRKYWVFESELASEIQKRVAEIRDIDLEVAGDVIQSLFTSDDQKPDWQAIACLASATRNFSVITGGPGTGKTYTVLGLLVLLITLQQKQKPDKKLNVALAAPTGKAAARVKESILDGLDRISIEKKVRDQIPTEAKTLHRLLGYQHNSTEFKHNKKQRLDYDVIVVDEASMIDLAMTRKLIAAVPDEAMLILLGDKDQLASVEAGAVLGDICSPISGELNHISSSLSSKLEKAGITNFESWIHASNDLQDAITELKVSRRFKDKAGIGILAGHINQQESDQALDVLRSEEYLDVELLGFDQKSKILSDHGSFIKQLKKDGITAEEAFEIIDQKQILCAHRKGPNGTEDLNHQLENQLRPKHGIYANSEWFPGRVIMITENDYNNNLFNGDIGITLWNQQKERLEITFKDNSGGQEGDAFKSFTTAQLVSCETAFAISVHKSQGSEFEEVLLVLPEKKSPILTKELIYTALTRAKSKFTAISTTQIFKEAVENRIQRSSGLIDKLWRSD